MQTRVAVMAVIVEDDDAAEKLNAVLHHYGEHMVNGFCGKWFLFVVMHRILLGSPHKPSPYVLP